MCQAGTMTVEPIRQIQIPGRVQRARHPSIRSARTVATWRETRSARILASSSAEAKNAIAFRPT